MTSTVTTDKVKQYESVREAMARIYEDEPTFFEPAVITPLPAPSDQIDLEKMAEIQQRQKIDRELIKKGYDWLKKREWQNRVGIF